MSSCFQSTVGSSLWGEIFYNCEKVHFTACIFDPILFNFSLLPHSSLRHFYLVLLFLLSISFFPILSSLGDRIPCLIDRMYIEYYFLDRGSGVR